MVFYMYDQFNAIVKAAYFNFLPFFSQTHEQPSAQGITPTTAEGTQKQRAMDCDNSGGGYYMEQPTSVLSIPCPSLVLMVY